MQVSTIPPHGSPPLCVSACRCRIHDTDLKYYANGEDAYEMRKYFKEKKVKASKGAKAVAAEPSS